MLTERGRESVALFSRIVTLELAGEASSGAFTDEEIADHQLILDAFAGAIGTTAQLVKWTADLVSTSPAELWQQVCTETAIEAEQ